MPDAADVLRAPTAGRAAIRGGGLRIAGYGIGAVIGLAWVPFLIRSLGVVEFGRYVLALSVATLFASVLEGGLGSIAVREYATRTGDDRRRFFGHLLGLRLLSAILSIVLAVGFCLIAGYPGRIALGTGLAGVGLALTNVQITLSAALTAQLRFGAVVIADLLRQITQAVLVAVLLLHGAGVAGYLATGIPAALVPLLVVMALVRGDLPLRPRYERAAWVSLLRNALAYSAAATVYGIYFRVVVIILSLLSTPYQTGLYATAYRVIELLLIVPNLLVSTLFPVLSRAARHEPARLVYGARRMVETSLVLGVGAALAVGAAAPVLIDLLAGSAGHASVPVLRLTSAALATTFLAVAAGYALLALHEHRAILLSALGALGTTVVGSVVLVPLAGSIGGAVASVLAELALAATALHYLRRACRAPMLELATAAPVLAGLLAGVALAVVFGQFSHVAGAAAAMLGYAGTVAALGGLAPEVLEAVGLRDGGRRA